MKIELIVTDMDGTAVKYSNEPFYSSWDALADVFSEEQRKEWFTIRDKYLSKGNGFYREWFDKQVSSLRGIAVSAIEDILFPVPYTKGFRDFFMGLNGIKKAILSGGLDIVAEKIFEEVGFDYLVSQKLGIQKGYFTGRGKSFETGLDKSPHLIELCKKARVDLSRTCYVGDSRYDVSCLELVGMPVIFEPKQDLKSYAKQNSIVVIDDFRELKNHLKC